ncbi:hypothetical protein DPMN_116491 [Dreissena polymorpha]|uniref:Uncharacterized protein n=1 Tax=Dreissena polymorpha TaxID=45954 RepID=A0A9D4QUS7_DREPO|nr:hypothetical protein DPMN_116491 [Dreissena polymorpha]
MDVSRRHITQDTGVQIYKCLRRLAPRPLPGAKDKPVRLQHNLSTLLPTSILPGYRPTANAALFWTRFTPWHAGGRSPSRQSE